MILLLLLSVASLRAETSLVVHTVSYHFSGNHSLNGVNPGVGVRSRSGDLAFQAGFFRNSHERRSYYGLIDWQPVHLGHLSAGIFAGTVDGYPWHHGAFFPAGGAVVNLRVRGFDGRIRYLPASHINAAALCLELGVTRF